MPFIQYDGGRPAALWSTLDEPDYRPLGRTPAGRLILSAGNPADVPSLQSVAALFAVVDAAMAARPVGRAVMVDWSDEGWWPHGSTRPAVPWGARSAGTGR